MFSKSQTLITGVYRTGSEYLTQLLNCHPQINASMYAVNMLRFMYDRYSPISEEVNYLRAIADTSERLLERYQIELNQNDVLALLKQTSKVDYGNLYDAIMSALYLNSSRAHWAEKNQLLWREIPKFLELMPNGKSILIIRDPRSVLASFKRYTYAPAPAYLGSVFNCFDAMLNAKKYLRDLPMDKFHLVRYEDLVRSPQQYAEQLWNFIGLDKTAKINQRQDWLDAYGNAWNSNSSFEENNDEAKFDINASIDRWRENIDDTELSIVEAVCAPLMKDFGYELACNNSANWPEVLKLFIGDVQVSRYFELWLQRGKGIQEFPTDPTQKENWSENRI